MKAFLTPMFGLPRPARHERGEGWGEGLLSRALKQVITSFPRPSPPFHGGEGVICVDASGGAR